MYPGSESLGKNEPGTERLTPRQDVPRIRVSGKDEPGTKRLIAGQNGPGIRVTGQDGPGTKKMITGQDGHRIRVTGQDGPKTKRFITGQYGTRIEVTGQDGPDMKRLTKRNKNGHDDASHEIAKRYLQKILRVGFEEAGQGIMSETIALASQALRRCVQCTHVSEFWREQMCAALDARRRIKIFGTE